MQVSHSFLDVIQQYFAECALLPVFLLAVIWIVKKWKPEYKKFIIAIACGGVLIFNELVYRIFAAVGEGSTYYRLFWIVPIAFVIAVFAVEAVSLLEKWKQAAVIGISLLAIFMFCGQTGEEWFSLPENIYQIDEDAIQVADTVMELTGGEATYIIDNGDLSNSIRLYDARIMYADLEEYTLYDILNKDSKRILGRDLTEAIWNNRCRYLALKKDDPFMYKLMEGAGILLETETDNYRIYKVDYDKVYADWTSGRRLTKGLINWATVENIPIAGMQEEYGYVYISNFGDIANEEVYQEMFDKIEAQKPLGIIINDTLSEYAEWYVQYEDKLAELQIPYYCNNQELQVIEQESFIIYMMNNSDGITDKALTELKALMQQEKPIVLVLSSAIESEEDAMYALLSENDGVVYVLSAKEGEYVKALLCDEILQYAIPVDENQILSMLYIRGLEENE